MAPIKARWGAQGKSLRRAMRCEADAHSIVMLMKTLARKASLGARRMCLSEDGRIVVWSEGAFGLRPE